MIAAVVLLHAIAAAAHARGEDLRPALARVRLRGRPRLTVGLVTVLLRLALAPLRGDDEGARRRRGLLAAEDECTRDEASEREPAPKA